MNKGKIFLIVTIFFIIFCVLFLWKIQFFDSSQDNKENAVLTIITENTPIGMGYKVSSNLFVTAWHVVRDENRKYFIQENHDNETVQTRYKVIKINKNTDTAFLVPYNQKIQEIDEKNIFSQDIFLWKKVHAFVYRNNQKIRLDGEITAISQEVAGYNEIGEINIFSARILTNIDFMSGDSGTPLFDENNILLDIAHISHS